MGENDALRAYRSKQDLSPSREPSGGRRRPGRRPAFVVLRSGKDIEQVAEEK